MDAFTTKHYVIDKAPRRIELLGDKNIRPEPAQHVIEFPGGAVEVSRTTDGNYWAHIIANRDFMDRDCDGVHHAYGEIIGGRIDADTGVHQIPSHEEITQIAILIRPSRVLRETGHALVGSDSEGIQEAAFHQGKGE